MALDLPTLVAVAALVMAVTAAASTLAWLQDRRQVSLLWMAAALAMGGLGAVLRVVLPGLAAILCGNVAVLLAFAAVWAACRALNRPDVPLLPLLAAPAIWTLACCFPFFQSNLDVRIALSSLLCSVAVGMALRELWLGRQDGLLARRILIAMMVVDEAILLARIPGSLLPRATAIPPIAIFSDFRVMGVVGMSITLLIALVMIMLVKDRTRRTHRLDAETDHLTGLQNRRQFERDFLVAFGRSARRGMPMALLMIDVDRFKAYNDLYGHPAGDVCLRMVAQVLDEGTHEPFSAAYRYGGEEFAVMIPNADDDGAARVAENLRRAVAALGLEHAEGESGIVTISLGCASMVPMKRNTPAELLGAADRALYHAKMSGRDRTCSAAPSVDELAFAG